MMLRLFISALFGLAAASCASSGEIRDAKELMTDSATVADAAQSAPEYLIGPLDELEVFVWRAPELSTEVTVRPDGRISTPLVEDMVAAGKTPTTLAKDLEGALKTYVRTPQVTVIVSNFTSTPEQQVRVLGEAQRPVALPYQSGMTVLDVMVSVGGLTEFAAGNKAVLIRGKGEEQKSYRLKLDDLLRKGSISANVAVLPGDVILIPESLF